MLRISVRLGLSGWRLETCVPSQACVPRFLPTQRSSTSRQGSSSPPGVSSLQNARFGGYCAVVTATVAVHRGNPGLARFAIACYGQSGLKGDEEEHMGRLVRAVTIGGLQAGDAQDNYMERVAKLVPSEILAGYLAIENLITRPQVQTGSSSAAPSSLTSSDLLVSYVVEGRWLAISTFVVLLIFNVIYLFRSRTPGEPYRGHIFLSSIAFLVWVYATKGTALYPLYHPTLAGVLVILFTLGVGIYQPQKAPVGQVAAPQG